MVTPQPENDSRTWISAAATSDLLTPSYPTVGHARHRLLILAHGGQVAAKCSDMLATVGRQERRVPIGGGIIDPAFWRRFEHPTEMELTDFAAGLFRTWDTEPSPRTLYAFGVEFCEAQVRSLVETRTPGSPSASARPVKNLGGRPSKAYWEPLLIEMATQLYAGDLKPKKQAEVLDAMLDWLSKQGHEDAGLTQVKDRARKLWESISK